MLKTSVFLALALAIVFSLSACGQSPQEATPTPIAELSQEQKEFIEFLEAEDEQFDYLAINKVHVMFKVSYFFSDLRGNSFTNQEVTGCKHWDMDVWNLKDESGEPIKGLGATFTTDLVASKYKKGQLTENEKLLRIGPPVYVWSYGDIPQEEEHEPQFRPSPYVEFPNQLVVFTPGFDCSRSADKTIFSGPGVQTLTLTIIPRDENIERTSATGMCIYTVIPGGENLVDAIITSPTTDHEHIEVSEDRRSLRIVELPLKTNTPWSINLTIEVTPKPGVSTAEFLPFTSFIWDCGSVEEYHDRGTTTGSSVSCAADSVGTWKWKAKGNYIWEWQSGLCSCLVAFRHLQERVEE